MDLFGYNFELQSDSYSSATNILVMYLGSNTLENPIPTVTVNFQWYHDTALLDDKLAFLSLICLLGVLLGKMFIGEKTSTHQIKLNSQHLE
jgi:hypothetical protein